MGLRELNAELAGVLEEGAPDSSCCGNLGEAIRRLAVQAGLQEEALLEAMKCNGDCRSKFTTESGSFNEGEDVCKKMFSECCTGVKDPAALCAWIGRRANK